MAWCSLSCLSMSGAPGCRGLLSSGTWHQVRFHGTDVDKQRPSRCNELLCLHGGVHVEPSCLCYRCVKIGTISWVGCVLLGGPTRHTPRQPGRGYEKACSVSICLTIACKVGRTKALARMILTMMQKCFSFEIAS